MAREAWRLWDDKLSEEYVFSVNPSSDSGAEFGDGRGEAVGGSETTDTGRSHSIESVRSGSIERDLFNGSDSLLWC